MERLSASMEKAIRILAEQKKLSPMEEELIGEVDALRAERDDARENSNRFQMKVRQLRAAIESWKKEEQCWQDDLKHYRDALQAIAQLQGDPDKTSAAWAGDIARKALGKQG